MTIDDENNNTAMTNEGFAANNAIPISSATTWAEIIPATTFYYDIYGRHFGVLTVTIIFQPDASYQSRLWIGLANNYGTITATVPVMIPYMAGSDDYRRISVSLTFLLPSFDGYAVNPDTAFIVYAKKMASTDPTITTLHYNVTLSQINKHDHPYTDPTHTNPITDLNHTNPFNDNSQQHAANNAPTSVTTYPTDVVVKVNGTTVKTDAGGVAQLLDCGDITAYLVNGANTIELTSSASGNAALVGNYISYGS